MTALVTALLPVASHVPSVDTKVTVVVGDGAVTEIVTGVPSEAPVGSEAGAVIWNATEAPVTVYEKVLVSPKEVIVSVTVPGAPGVTTDVNVPVASVVPLSGASVTLPVPAAVMVTAWPDNTEPEALFTVTDSVALAPPTTSDDAVEATVTVAPVMRIGICVDLPLAVAVIVAVRLAGFEDPEEKVTVALPDASETAEPSERNPVSAENAMLTPATAALAASTTVAVMVVVVLLSDATLVCEALRLMAAAAGGGMTTGGGVVDVVPDPPPPQALNRLETISTTKSQTNLDEILFT